MRYFILFLHLLFILYCASAQNYFKDGVIWVMKYEGTSAPPDEAPKGYSTTFLYKAPNDSVLSMYEHSDKSESEPSFIAYIKTEGDKVYFNQYEDSIPKWNLLYDFGMQPGEGCYIYSPLNYNLKRPRKPVREYMVCTDIHPDPDNPGWEIMEMEVYDEEDSEKPWDRGRWIKGLGSEMDVDRSNAFHLEGGGSDLIQVYDNDKLIYSKFKVKE
ncbi:MAG: hypothetical protein K2H76_04795 [Muribaculaceae bacterium]|nr:hypothetical protein [Muribaculaceae bacterium]